MTALLTITGATLVPALLVWSIVIAARYATAREREEWEDLH